MLASWSVLSMWGKSDKRKRLCGIADKEKVKVSGVANVQPFLCVQYLMVGKGGGSVAHRAVISFPKSCITILAPSIFINLPMTAFCQ